MGRHNKHFSSVIAQIGRASSVVMFNYMVKPEAHIIAAFSNVNIEILSDSTCS